jgi:hypothetical protein
MMRNENSKKASPDIFGGKPHKYIPLQPEPFKIIAFDHKHRVIQEYPKNIGFVPKTSGFG